MKIKTCDLDFEKVCNLPRDVHQNPKKPNMFWRNVIHIFSSGELKEVGFTHEEIGMERLKADEPCLVLMNHSSFIDLKIASSLLFPRPYNIVCTSDGFVGKGWLMRNIGCIPTQKFVMDTTLVRDMNYALKKLKSSVLMFPEASYTFDGTATPLPESIGKCVKLLGVPLVIINTTGAFTRDPLYNMLKLRKVKVSAKMEYVLSPDEIKEKSADEINAIINKRFNFDGFKWQQENKIEINEDFRADGLNRVLYKCPSCKSETGMHGQGTKIICKECGKEYELDKFGYLKALSGETEFPHIPNWFKWERECVRKEIEDGTYKLDIPVKIYMMVDKKCVYRVGVGRLTHNLEGFHLTGCEGKLDYKQKPTSSYSLYSDYYWYEIGDMICIGDKDTLYYCFPEGTNDVVAKTRIAAEELYKFVHSKKQKNN